MQRPMRFWSGSSSRPTSEQGRARQEDETGGRGRALHSETSVQDPSPSSRRLTGGQDRSRTPASASNLSRPAEGVSGGWVWPCARAKRPASPRTRAGPPVVAQPLQAARGIHLPTAPSSSALGTSRASHNDRGEPNRAMVPYRHPTSGVPPPPPPEGPSDSPPRRALAARLEPTGQPPPSHSLSRGRSLLRPLLPSPASSRRPAQRPASAESSPLPPSAIRSSSRVSSTPAAAPPTATDPVTLDDALPQSFADRLVVRVSFYFLVALRNYVILVGRTCLLLGHTSFRTLFFIFLCLMLLQMVQSLGLLLILLPLLIPVIHHIYVSGHPSYSIRNPSSSTPPSAQETAWQELCVAIQEYAVRALVAVFFFFQVLLTLLQTAASSVRARARAPGAPAAPAGPPVVLSQTESLPLPPSTDNPHACAICWDAPATHLCYPCGHKAGCQPCLTRQRATFKKCPICRAGIQDIIRVIDVS